MQRHVWTPPTTRALLELLCPRQQRRITAHMAQLKATLVNNASCSSDFNTQKCKKDKVSLWHLWNTPKKPSKRKLPRRSCWGRCPYDTGQDHAEILLKTLGTAWMYHCFSQTEQQSITATKCCGNQSTKKVKLPHREVQTETFWCSPGGRDAETPTNSASRDQHQQIGQADPAAKIRLVNPVDRGLALWHSASQRWQWGSSGGKKAADVNLNTAKAESSKPEAFSVEWASRPSWTD